MYSHQRSKFLRASQYTIIGLIVVGICILFNPKDVAFASDQESIGSAYSWLTILMTVAGMAIFIKYINSMFVVLREASVSYSEIEEDEEHIAYFASPFWGAALAGIIAAFVIWSYGVSYIFLYIGPILCLISPVAIIYCMSQDIQSFKRMHPDSNTFGEDVLVETAER